jgi:hypothetical protein
MFRLLPHAQLAVLPGTDHMAFVKRVHWQVSTIESFLDAPMPAAGISATSFERLSRTMTS